MHQHLLENGPDMFCIIYSGTTLACNFQQATNVAGSADTSRDSMTLSASIELCGLQKSF